MDHNVNVLDNVKNLFRRVESLAIDPVTAKCREMS